MSWEFYALATVGLAIVVYHLAEIHRILKAIHAILLDDFSRNDPSDLD